MQTCQTPLPSSVNRLVVSCRLVQCFQLYPFDFHYFWPLISLQCQGYTISTFKNLEKSSKVGNTGLDSQGIWNLYPHMWLFYSKQTIGCPNGDMGNFSKQKMNFGEIDVSNMGSEISKCFEKVLRQKFWYFSINSKWTRDFLFTREEKRVFLPPSWPVSIYFKTSFITRCLAAASSCTFASNYNLVH